MRAVFGNGGRFFVPANPAARIFKGMANDSSSHVVAQKKAAVNAPPSRRFAKFKYAGHSRQRLDCGGFSTAFSRDE
jgi:hypothetical protein